MRGKVWRIVVLAVLAISVPLILWLTLFSRHGNESRHFYPPFWSYRALADGNGKVLFEVIGNVILFIPVGVIAVLILHLNLWQAVVLGFSLSLLIESCQWIFALGIFELDDLLHNTLGTAIGTILVKKLPLFRDRKKNALILILLICLTTMIGFCCQAIRIATMSRYAAMNDKQDGTKNLLVLSPDPRFFGESDFTILYKPDGSVLVEGKAENRVWIEIGKVKLQKGRYSLEDLSDKEKETIAIALDHYNEKEKRYIRLTKEVGRISNSEFTIDETEVVRLLICIYPGARGRFIIRPAVYRIE